MKRILITLVSIITLALASQAQDALFKKYADQEGVSVVNISKKMLSMMPNLGNVDKRVTNLASKLDGIRIINTTNKKVAEKMRKDALSYVGHNGYEEILSHKEGGQAAYILQRELNKGNYEYLVISLMPSQVAIVDITGRLTLEEIQSLSDNL